RAQQGEDQRRARQRERDREAAEDQHQHGHGHGRPPHPLHHTPSVRSRRADSSSVGLMPSTPALSARSSAIFSITMATPWSSSRMKHTRITVLIGYRASPPGSDDASRIAHEFRTAGHDTTSATMENGMTNSAVPKRSTHARSRGLRRA